MVAPPDNALLLARAATFVRDGEIEEAQRLYEQVLARDPGEIEAIQMLGAMLIQLERPTEALNYLNQAIAISPNHAGIYHNLAIAYERLEKPLDAVVAYCRTLELQPDLAKAHTDFGQLLLRQGNREAAVTHFLRSLHYSPRQADVHGYLATALSQLGYRDAAKAYHQQAAARMSGGAEARPALRVQGRANVDVDDFAAPASSPGTSLESIGQTTDSGQNAVDDAIAEFSSVQQTLAGTDLQSPFAVAVVIPTLLRPSLSRAVESVYNQQFDGRVQILIGIDQIQGDLGLLAHLAKRCPPHCAVTIFNLGYSTAARHGGLHPGGCGGTLRTIMSYAANSRLVAYLDDDNWWREDHLATLRAAIQGHHWAFSWRWYVDPTTQKPLSIDGWESVGPNRGVFQERFGGFVDPSSLMVDKLACEPVLRWWSIPLSKEPPNDMSEDRCVFDRLRRYNWRTTGLASSFYLLHPYDSMHSQRLKWINDANTQNTARP